MITGVHAAQRLDSRGNPTVQVCVSTAKGDFKALVPSGASKGKYEALELRDNDPKAYHGLGVTTAVRHINREIGPLLIKKCFNVATELSKIDGYMKELDGTPNKSRFGANAILGVSMACARAGAEERRMPLYEFLRREAGATKPYILPVPFFNVLNGGMHSGNAMAFQEFMIAPSGATTFAQAVQYGPIGIGDEGGFAPPISEPHEALELLDTAVKNCGHAGKFEFAIDPASTEFFREDGYDLGVKMQSSRKLSRESLMELYKDLIKKYPIHLLEDPFAQDDWDAWTEFHKQTNIELVGDDLLATNIERMKIAVEKKACNALLLKINQIGTITESLNAAKFAFDNGWSVFVSHRSGETTDDFIADLTIALRGGHLKSGAPCRGERVVKYNRLMDIEEELHATGDLAGCHYAGAKYRGMDIYGGL